MVIRLGLKASGFREEKHKLKFENRGQGFGEMMLSAVFLAMLGQACCVLYMGVSKNRGTPKWMVYNGKPY